MAQCYNYIAMTNFTEDGKHKTPEELICSAEFTEGIQNRLIFFSAIYSFLSVSAFLGNVLVLVALQKAECSLHAPSKLLFRTLATTDLCVGIIAGPLTITASLSVVSERWDICRFACVGGVLTSFLLASVTLFTLTAISVDRLLALLLGLRYRQIVTLKRMYITVAVLWILTVIDTGLYFFNYLITLWYSYIVVSFCLVISVFSYVRIFLALRHNQIQVQSHVHQRQPSQTIPLNITRYRKTVYNALWVQLALVICYLPNGIMMILTTEKGLTPSVFFAWGFAVALVFLNSSLNPILYCWKITEVRRAVKDTIRQFCCPCS